VREAREVDARPPAELAARAARVADQLIDLGRAAEPGVLAHVVAPVEAGARERELGELATLCVSPVATT
jgi:hypothetical protein